MQAEDINTDVILITRQIMFGKLFQIVKLTLIIFNICYFLGMFWYIVAMSSKDAFDKADENRS